MAYLLTYGDGALFDPYTDDVVYDAELTAKSNNPDYLDFTVPRGHALYGSVRERGELVRLSWDGVSLFVGEVESIDVDMEGNKEVSCVGALGWLNDTVVRPYSTVTGEQPNTAPSSVDGLFRWYVEQHNAHMLDSRKRFAVGANQGYALDGNNHVYRSSKQLPSTWDEISDKILDDLGGYVTVGYGDVLTLNLYADVHETNAQVIDLGVNITDFSSKTDAADMYTAVRPEGADVDGAAVTVAGLPDGAQGEGVYKQGDAVYAADAVSRYGYREYAYSNTDCETAESLLASAITKLQALMSPTVTVTVKAVDLALYMEGYDHLKVGQAVRVRSALHGVDEYLMVSSVVVDLQDPGNTEYTLGAEYSTLTGQQSSYLKSQTANINKALDTATAMSADAKAAAKDAADASTAAQTAAESAESAAQTAGKAVTTVTVEYAVGDAQAAPESGWGTATPTRSEGQTVWMRTVTATAEGATSTSEPAPVTGDAGDQGPQGADGKSPTATVTKSGTTATITVNNTDGTSTTATVSDGEKGEKGDAGAKGDQGPKGDAGVDGASVAAVKLQYAICDSSTTAPASSWQDSVPDWQTGCYIWQRSVTTIEAADGSTTEQYGDAALFGVMNSLAGTVDGHTTQITQMGDQIVTKASKESVTTQVNSAVQQTADELSATIQTVSDTVAAQGTVTGNVSSYMTFADPTGGSPQLTIGTTSSDMKTVITNDQMRFEQSDGTALLTVDGSSSSVTARNLVMGDYQWQTPGAGRIQLVYVGGSS